MTASVSATLGDRAQARSSRFRTALLLSAMWSSVLYVLTDVVGGLRYDGFSFWSQGVSELMAVESPSRGLVMMLMSLYGVLALAGGIGIYREGASQGRAVRVMGALVTAYALIGFTGPFVDPIHARGIAPFETAMPHIILTGALVLCMLLAMIAGAFSLDATFRHYSVATIALFVAGGIASAIYGALLADNEPTPGFGLVERVMIYGFLAWVFLLAWMLVRASAERTGVRQ